MSTTSYEWAKQPRVVKLFSVLGFRLTVRWDEDWVTYRLYRDDGWTAVVRGHEDDLAQLRAQVMWNALEERQ